jgi:hypothetical protein
MPGDRRAENAGRVDIADADVRRALLVPRDGRRRSIAVRCARVVDRVRGVEVLDQKSRDDGLRWRIGIDDEHVHGSIRRARPIDVDLAACGDAARTLTERVDLLGPAQEAAGGSRHGGPPHAAARVFPRVRDDAARARAVRHRLLGPSANRRAVRAEDREHGARVDPLVRCRLVAERTAAVEHEQLVAALRHAAQTGEADRRSCDRAAASGVAVALGN